MNKRSIQELVLALQKQGFEIVHPFDPSVYNSLVGLNHRFELNSSSMLGLLVGNTRSLWPKFLEALAGGLDPSQSENPFDDFVESEILAAVGALPIRIRFSHKPAPFHIAFQRLAHGSGLAFLNKAHLCIHPKYGPWFSLRAALLIEGITVADLDHQPVKACIENPCSNCDEGCVPAFEKAMALSSPSGPEIKKHWKAWHEVRLACPHGHEYQFYSDQALYHYTRDKSILNGE